MVKRTGAVAADYPDQPCSIVIGKGTDVPPVGVSVHWYPPIEPDAYNPASLGADGVYFYKLATFTVGDDGEMKVEYFCGKDNIQHFRELPMIGHVGSGEPIFKQYNPESGRYEYYSIKGIAPIKVEKVDDTLQVSLDPKDGSGTSIPVGSGIYRYMACDGVTVVAEFQWIQGAVVTNIGPPGFVEIPLGDCSDSSSSSSS